MSSFASYALPVLGNSEVDAAPREGMNMNSETGAVKFFHRQLAFLLH